ncbi:MAG TPA: hypothetical protein VMR52_02225 [Dehalococcoidia bacterium]|nr:hypothetical protein [Dehalococcoidia bacterium]
MSAIMRICFVLVACVLALAAAACGGGDDDDDGGQTAATTTAPAGDDDDDPGPGGEPEAFEETYPINETFWHQGFMIEIGDAIHAGTEPDIFGEQEFTLVIEADFTNEGADNRSLGSDVAMITPGGALNPLFGGIPSVPGGSTISGEFVFRVPEGFTLDDAYLLVGDGGEQQARVPLGPGGGELIALEPSEPPLSGTISTSLVDLDFTSAELRYDDPVNHQQVDDEKQALTLNFDATSRRSGNWSIFAQEFSLTLPSGSTIAVDGILLPGLPGSDAGLTTPDNYVRFLVDDPAEGDYVLNFLPSDRWYAEGEPTEYNLEFTLD